ncbi:MAG: hypothetical protein ACRCU0_04930 [Candidatus Rhabdochlamydia sp.]
MLNPIQAFGYMNSAIQSNTGYSFSQLAKNVTKVALPAIILASMYMSEVSAQEDFRTCLKDSDARACSIYFNHDDCINSCLIESSQYKNLLREMSACVQMCTEYFPI